MNRLFGQFVVLLFLVSGLNSCYFNSTARIYAKAQYMAQVNTADLDKAPNPVVYQNGSAYYIELPRYRYGMRMKIQHSIFDDVDDGSQPTLEFRGMGMFQVSEDFALYLTGARKSKGEVVRLNEVPNAAEIKMLSRKIPVVRKAGERLVGYVYRSPNAGWWRTLAPVNWVLVDLPVTVLENAAVVAGIAVIVWAAVEDDCDDCCDGWHHPCHH